MKSLNVAIIGCGKIGEKHAFILKSKKIKQLNLIAVCDINKDKAKQFGLKFNVNFFDNLETLLESTKVDLVTICTSSGHHYSNALTVSKYKKNIIIEKPICLSLSQAKDIVKIFKRNKNMIFVVMQNRLNPIIKLLKKAIDAKLLGRISSISIKVWWSRGQNYYDQADWRGTWDFDGGIFMNQAIHHLDMMTWLLGPVKSLVAIIKRRLVKIETEDVGSVILEFKNGVLGTMEASTALRPKNLENSITVLGELGNIKIGGLYMNDLEIYELQNKKKANFLLQKYKKEKKENNHYLFYQNVIENLSKRKKSNRKYIDGTEAIKSLELATGIYQSVIKKKRIYLPLKFNIKNNKIKLSSELKK
jgi:UDP-N-acetyl-2-amino-2-deoxyglucuronate dehydrogenase